MKTNCDNKLEPKKLRLFVKVDLIRNVEHFISNFPFPQFRRIVFNEIYSILEQVHPEKRFDC